MSSAKVIIANMHGNQIWAEMLDITSAVFADKIISIVRGHFFARTTLIGLMM